MCAVLFSHGMLIILAAIQTFVLSTELYTLTLSGVQWTKMKLSYLRVM